MLFRSERGAPLAGARFEDVRAPISTDGHGYFQATLAAGRDMVLRTPQGHACHVSLASLRRANGYAAAGTRICRVVQDELMVAKSLDDAKNGL